jgi:copper chaperone
MDSESRTIEINVGGMSCEHCVAAVGKAVRSVPGVTEARVDLKTGTVLVEGSFDQAQVIAAIKSAGYEAS